MDVAADKLKGEMMDLQHGQAFTRRVAIQASTGTDVSNVHNNNSIKLGQMSVVTAKIFTFYHF